MVGDFDGDLYFITGHAGVVDAIRRERDSSMTIFQNSEREDTRLGSDEKNTVSSPTPSGFKSIFHIHIHTDTHTYTYTHTNPKTLTFNL